ncbi:MAG: peptidoglycan DD-metalloendopeptidase family protein [Polaromonas sp.]
MSRLALPGALLAGLVLAAGCTSSLNNAPVEDRGTSLSRPADAAKPLPGVENAGKPGYYMVKPGDTMIRIGLENGQNWRDIARWNAIENPNLIEVGQVLRVIPPASDSTQVVTRPVTPGSVVPVPTLPASAARPASAPVAVMPPAPTPAPATSGSDEDVGWIWPAQGSLVAGFDEAKNKGLDISGKTGDAVLASADGRVVYAGAGLRGYGNLIILKHNNTFLTAYAHNQTLLVKEDQTVKRGQKIALMGNSDADRVKLHFEIRRQGKPVDPAKYLPAR